MWTVDDRIRVRVQAADYGDWRAKVEAIGGCAKPIQLTGGSTLMHTPTGEVIDDYGGTAWVPCGNRRAAVCPTCSDRYAADAFHLIRAGLSGGSKGVPTSVIDRPRAFVTLTPPSFGQVHKNIQQQRPATALPMRRTPPRTRPTHRCATRSRELRLRGFSALASTHRSPMAPVHHPTTPRDRTPGRHPSPRLQHNGSSVLRQGRRVPTPRTGPLPRCGPRGRSRRCHDTTARLGHSRPVGDVRSGRSNRRHREHSATGRGKSSTRLGRPSRHPTHRAHLRCRGRQRADQRRTPGRLHRQIRHQRNRQNRSSRPTDPIPTGHRPPPHLRPPPTHDPNRLEPRRTPPIHRPQPTTMGTHARIPRPLPHQIPRLLHHLQTLRGDRQKHRLAERLTALGIPLEDFTDITVINDWEFTGTGYTDDAEQELAAAIADRTRQARLNRHQQEQERPA